MEEKIIAIEKTIDQRKLLIAAGRGSLPEVRDFIQSKELDINFTDEDGYTLLHLAAGKGNLEVVKWLVEEKKVDVIVESNDNRTPLDIAREIKNQNIIDLLVDEIIDNSFEVLEKSSTINETDHTPTDTGLKEADLQVDKKIKQMESKIESCLEFLKIINSGVTSDQNGISYEQANTLIYVLETFALDGEKDEDTKRRLKEHFSRYYTESDRKLFSVVRERMLNEPDKKLSLGDILEFIPDGIKSPGGIKSPDEIKSPGLFFTKLEEYVQYVQYVIELKNFLKTTAPELKSKRTEEIDVRPCRKIFDNFIKEKQIEGIKLSQDEMNEFKEKFYPAFHESNDQVVECVESKSQKVILCETLKAGTPAKIGEKIDVEYYVDKEFPNFMVKSWTEKNITPELLFNFVVNFYPAFKKTSKKTHSDLSELRSLRNNLIHDFHKYGTKEFRKEISGLKHTLFKYYFAQQVNQALRAIEADEDPKIIDKTFKNKLKSFKDRYKNVMEEKEVISTDEAADFFGYKFSKMLFPESKDPIEILVDQYLKFMVIIDCPKDREKEEEQNRNPLQSRQELNAHSRRQIFEEFCRLGRIREHSNGNRSYYDDQKQEFENKLFNQYGVQRQHFREICSLHMENPNGSSQSDHSTESTKIIDIIITLKKIKDDHQLPTRVVNYLYDQWLNNKDSFGSDEHRRLLRNTREKDISRNTKIIDRFKHLPSDKIMNISIGEETLSISRGKVISNMLNTFYNARYTYTIQFNIEDIFNDETFLDYLVAKETEEQKIEDLVDPYLKLTMMFDEETEINGNHRKEIFDKFYSLKKLYKHSQNKRDQKYYKKEKEEFKISDLVTDHGIKEQDFDELCEFCIEEDYDLIDKKDGVNQVKNMINLFENLRKKCKNIPNEEIVSLMKEAKKGQVSSEKGQGEPKSKDEVKKMVNILNAQSDKSEVSIKLGKREWSVNIKKVTCDILVAFMGKLTVKLKDRNYMIIKKLLKVGDYTAPYIVRLITKVKSDAIVEKDDLVRLVDILLTKKESLHIESLNELLKLGSRKLNLYKEVCNKIVEPGFDIYSMRLIFEEYQHVKGILAVLIHRIESEDQSKDKMIELSRKVIKILVRDIFVFGFSEYEKDLDTFKQLLELIEKIKSSNDPIVTFEYDIKLKMAKVTNYQGLQLDENEATPKYKEALDILVAMKIPDDVYPQSLLALQRKATTYSLLGQYDKAYEGWDSLYKEIVKVVCGSDKSNTELYTNKMYTEIERSEEYKMILASSVEYNKHLNILRIRNSMARDRLSEGCLHKKVKHCKEALEIYKEVYSYQKCSLGPKHKNTASTESYIARAHYKIANVMSEQRKLNQDALKHSEFALSRNVRFAKMRKDMYGTYHPAINRTMSYIVYNLDQIAYLNEKFGDAENRSERKKKEAFYKKSRKIHLEIYDYRKRYLGERHESTLKTKDRAESIDQKLVHKSSTQLTSASRNWRENGTERRSNYFQAFSGN